jgi:hypothetical protein
MATVPGSNDQVRLSIPALPEFARLARLTVAGLASRLGFSYDEVEDLRIAVDELCHWLMGNRGHDGALTLSFTLGDGRLTIDGRSTVEGLVGEIPEDLSELSHMILGAVVGDFDCGRTGEDRWFHVQKTRAA